MFADSTASFYLQMFLQKRFWTVSALIGVPQILCAISGRLHQAQAIATVAADVAFTNMEPLS